MDCGQEWLWLWCKQIIKLLRIFFKTHLFVFVYTGMWQSEFSPTMWVPEMLSSVIGLGSTLSCSLSHPAIAILPLSDFFLFSLSLFFIASLLLFWTRLHSPLMWTLQVTDHAPLSEGTAEQSLLFCFDLVFPCLTVLPMLWCLRDLSAVECML